jgi:hypothetical protein
LIDIFIVPIVPARRHFFIYPLEELFESGFDLSGGAVIEAVKVL